MLKKVYERLILNVATVGAGKEIQFKCVFKAMLQVLLTAEKLNIKTIAVPELGTGIIGFLTQEQSARAILSAVYRYEQFYPNPRVEEINIIIFRGSTMPAEKVLSEGNLTFEDEKGRKPFDQVAWLREMGFL